MTKKDNTSLLTVAGLKDLFAIEKKPLGGLMVFEKVAIAYAALTTLLVLFLYTRMSDPSAILMARVRFLAMTLALWGVYRLVPCRLMLGIRGVVQLALLGLWYPETYDFNRLFPNLDHLFAQWEQQLFGCQPALLFSQVLPSHVASELFDMGYGSYYFMIAVTAMFYFAFRYREFERATFVILASFFIYYLIYIFLPVVGPTFYYHAVGLKTIAEGVFPNVHDYFLTHTASLPSPGYTDGVFYQFVEDAKAAGERPTAAFPSSHVGVSTICMLLAWHSGNRRLFFVYLPFYIFLCCATVYIQAHYLIDAIAGLITGVGFYFLMMWLSRGMERK
ncbi:phosphatase PAP2 family protein [uncultured Prevotella sp.]|uniref:phosphatase PAP2 family protein n=1 Tax=uncultured Prevotella sp. TaxID=159272 RepID=UPI0025894539|nr:phosphatase PAP2 family protein [uncultured Prevotella sp.]